MKHIKGLDALRGIAVLLVIIHHWFPIYQSNTLKGVLQKICIPSGEFGVTLFFVLSGYLITNILYKAKSSQQSILSIVRIFIIRRALRIFPIYYLYIISLLLLDYPINQNELAYYLTYTSNFLLIQRQKWTSLGHTWSLSVEEQFYLIWPWLILKIKNNKHVAFLILTFLIAPVSVILWLKFIKTEWYYVFTISCIDAFSVGALYAYLSQGNKLKVFTDFIKISLPICLLIYFTWKLMPIFGYFPRYSFFSRTIDSIISISIIHVIVTNQNVFINKWIINNSFLNLLGKISYGMYLFHYYSFPFIFDKYIGIHLTKFNFIASILKSSEGKFFILLPLLILFAYASFKLIEEPILKLKSKFEY